MRKYLLIVIALLAVAAGTMFYFKLAPANPSQAPNPRANITVSGPIPASSYGKGSVGAENQQTVTPSAPMPVSQLGILEGTAKPAAGAKPDFASIKISISDPKTNKELANANLGADGSYKFTVEPGEYVVNISPAGLSPQLPQRIYVGAGETIDVNFAVK